MLARSGLRRQPNTESGPSTRRLGEIRVDRRSHGVRAVYLVEVEDTDSARQLAAFFEGLSADVSAVELSTGKLTSYVVQVLHDDQRLLNQIEEFLGKNFPFVITHRHFDRPFYDMIADLCEQTGSTVRSIPKCRLCGSPEPFPIVVSFLDKRRALLGEGTYCAQCLADVPQEDARSFLHALKQADKAVADLTSDMTPRQRPALSIRTNSR